MLVCAYVYNVYDSFGTMFRYYALHLLKTKPNYSQFFNSVDIFIDLNTLLLDAWKDNGTLDTQNINWLVALLLFACRKIAITRGFIN